MSIGDECGLSARLEALEISMQKNQEEMIGFVQATRFPQVPVQSQTLQPPVRPQTAAQGSGNDQSYATMAGGGRRGRLQGQEPRRAGGHGSQGTRESGAGQVGAGGP